MGSYVWFDGCLPGGPRVYGKPGVEARPIGAEGPVLALVFGLPEHVCLIWQSGSDERNYSEISLLTHKINHCYRPKAPLLTPLDTNC